MYGCAEKKKKGGRNNYIASIRRRRKLGNESDEGTNALKQSRPCG